MPFTASHIAAVLPFGRTFLPPAALAIGAMAPDLPYFLPLDIDRDFTHSPLGVVTIDLAVALIALAAWLFVLRAPVLDFSPRWVRERATLKPRWRVRGPAVTTLATLLALEIGMATHLVLDEFTHEGGLLDSVAPWSGVDLGTFAVANLIHAAVSIALAAVLVLWVRRWALRTPRGPRPSRLDDRARLRAWATLTAVLAGVGLGWWVSAIAAGEHPLDPDLLGHSFFVAAGATGALALALALFWYRRKAR